MGRSKDLLGHAQDRLGKFTNPTSKWNVLAPQEGIWGFLAPAQGSRRTKVRGPQDPDTPLP